MHNRHHCSLDDMSVDTLIIVLDQFERRQVCPQETLKISLVWPCDIQSIWDMCMIM